MDPDHDKTGRKFLDLRSQKAGIGTSTLKEITTTLEAATRVEDEARIKAKTGLCTACFTREIQTIRQGIVLSS
jgi:hypothetical protein